MSVIGGLYPEKTGEERFYDSNGRDTRPYEEQPMIKKMRALGLDPRQYDGKQIENILREDSRDKEMARKYGISDPSFYRSRPMEPTLLDPRGSTISDLRKNMGETFKTTDALQAYAKGGASPWLSLAKQDLAGDVTSGMQSAGQRTVGRYGGLMGSMAAAGGIDQSATSRLGGRSAEQSALASQRVAGSGLLGQQDLDVEDEMGRQKVTEQLPGLLQGRNNFEKGLLDMEGRAADKYAENISRVKKAKLGQYGGERLGMDYKDIYGG